MERSKITRLRFALIPFELCLVLSHTTFENETRVSSHSLHNSGDRKRLFTLSGSSYAMDSNMMNISSASSELYIQPLSPASVVDMRTLEPEDDVKASLVAPLLLFSEGRLSSRSLTPPLDEVTTCSDDSASVSSVSSDETEGSMNDDDFNDQTPRSIFKTYWEKKGGSASIRRSSQPTDYTQSLSGCASDEESESSSANTYERTLRKNEGVSTSSRRIIFGTGCYSQSTPTLSLSTLVNDFRKTRSSSELERKPKASCLRPCRYSGQQQRNTSEGSTAEASVTFSKQVKVATFQPPLEKWAAAGWSDFFC